MALPNFIGYAAFMGFLISFTLLMYTATDITLAFVTASSNVLWFILFYGRFTKRIYRQWVKHLGVAVWGLIIAMFLIFFFASTGLTILISLVGVVIFAGLIAWDNQKITQVYNCKQWTSK